MITMVDGSKWLPVNKDWTPPQDFPGFVLAEVRNSFGSKAEFVYMHISRWRKIRFAQELTTAGHLFCQGKAFLGDVYKRWE